MRRPRSGRVRAKRSRIAASTGICRSAHSMRRTPSSASARSRTSCLREGSKPGSIRQSSRCPCSEPAQRAPRRRAARSRARSRRRAPRSPPPRARPPARRPARRCCRRRSTAPCPMLASGPTVAPARTIAPAPTNDGACTTARPRSITRAVVDAVRAGPAAEAVPEQPRCAPRGSSRACRRRSSSPSSGSAARPWPTSAGKISRSIETARPGGDRVEHGRLEHVGARRSRGCSSTRRAPASRRSAAPCRRARARRRRSATGRRPATSASVADAPRARCSATSAARSCSERMSPFSSRNVSLTRPERGEPRRPGRAERLGLDHVLEREARGRRRRRRRSARRARRGGSRRRGSRASTPAAASWSKR